MRQHVNPLSRYFQLPLELPSPENLFANSKLPIHLDIGSARGKFLLSMASLKPGFNHLGVEIRKPLVIAAERERVTLGLENLKFVFCNANISLENWLYKFSSFFKAWYRVFLDFVFFFDDKSQFFVFFDI